MSGICTMESTFDSEFVPAAAAPVPAEAPGCEGVRV
jgi:hypothetical protein